MPDLQTTLLIVIIVAIFGKPALAVLKFIPGFAPFIPLLEKLAGNGNGNGHKEAIPEWAKQLQLHYNEETTEILKRIEGKQNGIHDGVLTMNTKLDAIEPCKK